MAVIKLGPFGGERPQIDDFLLGPMHSTRARNCQLWHGTLAPMQGARAVKDAASASNPLTIFKYDSTNWFEWTTDKNVVRSLAPNDTFKRVYYTGDGSDYPKVTDNTRALTSAPYPAASLRVGVPAPTAAPTLTLVGGAGTAETRYYTYTYVNSYGEESPPSPVAKLSYLPGGTVDVDYTAPPGAPYDITKIYLYRSNTVGTTAVYQFVKEKVLPLGASPHSNDAVAGEALGEALQSESWDPPPSDMVGIINAGGFIVGFRNNEILPSELNLPHAYPVEYRKSVDYKIVGLGPIDGGFVIATEGQPYIAMGAHPGALALTPLQVPYACVSRRGIAVVDGAVIYPSTRGLVRIAPGEAELITEGVFDTADWLVLQPSTIRAFRWRNLYLAFYDAGDASGAFVIDPFRPEDGVVFYDGVEIGGGYTDLTEDKVHVSYAMQIAEWAGGVTWPYAWKSKPFELSAPTAMNILKVNGASYPATITVYCDGMEQARVAVGSNTPVRIPNGRRGRTYQVAVAGTGEVRKVWLAGTMREMKMAEAE